MAHPPLPNRCLHRATAGCHRATLRHIELTIVAPSNRPRTQRWAQVGNRVARLSDHVLTAYMCPRFPLPSHLSATDGVVSFCRIRAASLHRRKRVHVSTATG